MRSPALGTLFSKQRPSVAIVANVTARIAVQAPNTCRRTRFFSGVLGFFGFVSVPPGVVDLILQDRDRPDAPREPECM